MSREYRAASLEEFLDGQSYLKHYGVLGMKWGVRNSDTLRKYAGPQGRSMSSSPTAYGGRGLATRINRVANFKERAKARLTRSGKEIEPKSKRQIDRENNSKKKDQEEEQDEWSLLGRNGFYGMRWGTSDDSKPGSSAEPEQPKIPDYKKNPDPSKLSDSDLVAMTQRIQNEITYREKRAKLNEMTKPKSQKNREQFAKDVREVGRTVIKDWATNQLKAVMNDKVSYKKYKSKLDNAEKQKNQNNTPEPPKSNDSKPSDQNKQKSSQSSQKNDDSPNASVERTAYEVGRVVGKATKGTRKAVSKAMEKGMEAVSGDADNIKNDLQDIQIKYEALKRIHVNDMENLRRNLK